MSVLIKGMDMPRNSHVVIRIYSDGKVENETTERKIGMAVPLPAEHGRLGDLDKINASLEAMIEIEHNQNAAPYSWSYAYTEMQSILDDVPTIVPAEGGGKTDGE